MAENLISQGSITIKRLRRGYTVSLYFKNLTGVALYQGVDASGNVTPSWKDATDENRPQIQPVLEATNGLKPTIVAGSAQWTYLNVALSFGSNGACTTTGYTDKFKISTDGTYTLTIIGDLASSDNTANDTLTFACTAQVAGAAEQSIQGTVDIVISPLGASAYQGTVATDTGVITTKGQSVTLTLQLIFGTLLQDAFGYAIVKAGTSPTTITTATTTNKKATATISDTDVDGQTTFLVYFYKSGETDATKWVDCDGFSILDKTDDYKIEYKYKNNLIQEIDDGQNVTVVPYIVSIDGQKTITPTNPSWSHQVYRLQEGGATWVATRSAAVTTEEVELSTADTDYTDDNGNTIQCNVEVVGSVSFSL